MEEWRKKPFYLFGYHLWEETISREDIEKELMEKFKQYPGINFNFSQYIRDNVEEALSGVKGANSVKIIGSDLHTLESLGQKVANLLRGIRGIENVACFTSSASPTSRSRSTANSALATVSTWLMSKRSCRPPSAAKHSRKWSKAKNCSISRSDSRTFCVMIPRSSTAS